MRIDGWGTLLLASETSRWPDIDSPVEEWIGAADTAAALISFYDFGHICRYANSYHRLWCHRDPATYVGLHMSDCIGPDLYARHLPFLAKVAGGEEVSFASTVPHRDGGLCGATVRYIPKRTQQGLEGFFIHVSFDGERNLAQLLDLAHDTIFVRNVNDAVTYWNVGAERLFGWRREEAVGRNAHDLIETVFPAPIEQINAELFASGVWEGELVRKTRDGLELIIAARWALRRDAEGAPVEILEAGRDITARRQANEELRRSEYRYRNMFQAMAVSFWECDFTGVGEELRRLKGEGVLDLKRYFADNPAFIRSLIKRTIAIDVNQRSVELFRARSREELLGPTDRFWPAASEWVFAQSVLAALNRSPNYETETKLLAVDGDEIDVHFTVSFSQENVGAGAILIGLVDMTERNRAQDELRKAQAELAHAARISTLGEMAASIAHEVNQPLAAIVTGGEAGLRWLKRDQPDIEEAKSAIARIVSDGQRAAEIIARIRAMSTKAAPEKTAVAVNETVEAAIAFVRHELSAHDIALRLDLAPDLPSTEADRVQLQQVMVNLLMNAIQAMADVADREHALAIRSRLNAESLLQVDVVDSGPGVETADADRLFKAFFTTKATGMGMGLSICRSIIEAHGGRIWAEKNEGAGSTFTFVLPPSA